MQRCSFWIDHLRCRWFNAALGLNAFKSSLLVSAEGASFMITWIVFVVCGQRALCTTISPFAHTHAINSSVFLFLVIVFLYNVLHWIHSFHSKTIVFRFMWSLFRIREDQVPNKLIYCRAEKNKHQFLCAFAHTYLLMLKSSKEWRFILSEKWLFHTHTHAQDTIVPNLSWPYAHVWATKLCLNL